MNSQYDIGSLIKELEQDYVQGTTQLSKYVEFSQYENIEKIDAYANKKHISGDTDSLGREKPFFDVVTAAINIWWRATDIDRKNIRIRSTKAANVLFSFLASIKLQEWMRRARFGVFLNEWGRMLAKYGSAVVKFVDKGDHLDIEVVPWSRLISDTVNFKANPKVEKFYITEGELRANENYDIKEVEDLISAKQARKTKEGQRIDNKSDFYEIYELHGYLPKAYLTGDEEDRFDYCYQMHTVCFQINQDNKDQRYTLYSGQEKKDIYMITHLIKEDGREQSIGAVEHLFDVQWMQNHTIKAMKDQLDLASKLIFQTTDGNLVGMNVLNSIENGDVIVTGANSALSVVGNNSHDIGALQTLAQMFVQNGQSITGTTDAISGNTMPSGTPYSSVALLNQESHNLFEIMAENKGLHITDMMTDFIIPHIKTKLDSTKEIAEILSDENIQYIDSIYVPHEAIRRHNEAEAEKIFSGLVASPYNKEAAEQGVKNELSAFGNQRFIKPSEIKSKSWKEVLKDIEWEVEVETTGEGSDKKAALATLSTVFQTIASNPAVLQDPNARMVFNQLLETAGVLSPLSFQAPKPTPAVAPSPAGGGTQAVEQLATQTQ